MKQKILKAQYYPDTGHTQLKVHNKYGTFEAWVKVHPEDEEIENRWDGFKFCEYKIAIQTLKAKARVLLERVNGMAHLSRVLNKSGKMRWTDDIYPIEVLIDSQVNAAERDYLRVRNQYKMMEQRYPEFCEQILAERRKARDKFKNEEPTE